MIQTTYASSKANTSRSLSTQLRFNGTEKLFLTNSMLGTRLKAKSGFQTSHNLFRKKYRR